MRDLPKPIPFGTHDGVQYFLLSSDDTLPEDDSQDDRYVSLPPLKIGKMLHRPFFFLSQNTSFGMFDTSFKQATFIRLSSPFISKRNL